jgi:LysR family transcriptional regulator, transcriptional activator of nhaA
MEWLNYHHLLYFWTVAHEGSVTRACQRLHLAQPTVSAQLRQLEKSIGAKLFERRGRGLTLTETGRLALEYADEIFSLGRELREVLSGRPALHPLRFAVGVPDSLPKLVTYRILEPALKLSEPIQLVCVEGKLEQLYADFAGHQLDLLISDSPAESPVRVRAFSHLLGESTVSVFGTKALAAKYGRKFPESLEDAPLLLPARNMLVRRSLDQWFDARGIRPRVVAEIEDSALLKTFGQAGRGLFVGSSVIEREICRQYDVRRLGRLESVKERFFAITPERRTKHPAITEITKEARRDLFG